MGKMMAYDTDTPAAATFMATLGQVATATSSERNIEAYAHLDRLLKLPPGWDGYQGRPPTDEAVAQTKAFIANLPADLSMPAIEPSGDGELNLVWRSACAYLEVGFCGADQFSFFGKTKTHPELRVFGDVPIATNRLPLKLQWLLGQFGDGVPVRDHVAEPAPVAWAS